MKKLFVLHKNSNPLSKHVLSPPTLAMLWFHASSGETVEESKMVHGDKPHSFCGRPVGDEREPQRRDRVTHCDRRRRDLNESIVTF